MIVRNLRTIDINRIINKFNIHVINSSTIRYDCTKGHSEYCKFKEYVTSISDKAEIVDEVI